MAKKAVFFDCWSTLISFQKKTEDWNVHSLKEHALNFPSVDWKAVDAFDHSFLDSYYRTNHDYEITAACYLKLVCQLFQIKLDCSIDTCAGEILSFLDPQPVPGIERFLKYLEEESIYYAILSNTIYTAEETIALINRKIPTQHADYFFASSDIGVKKPNPLFFLASIKDSGYDVKDSYYVGDSPLEDVYGSFRAGFKKSIWLNSRHLKMDDYKAYFNPQEISYLEVSSYDELLEDFRKGLL